MFCDILAANNRPVQNGTSARPALLNGVRLFLRVPAIESLNREEVKVSRIIEVVNMKTSTFHRRFEKATCCQAFPWLFIPLKRVAS
jgi:hypothetical protein